MLSTPGLFGDLIVQATENIRVSPIVLVHHLAKEGQFTLVHAKERRNNYLFNEIMYFSFLESHAQLQSVLSCHEAPLGCTPLRKSCGFFLLFCLPLVRSWTWTCFPLPFWLSLSLWSLPTCLCDCLLKMWLTAVVKHAIFTQIASAMSRPLFR